MNKQLTDITVILDRSGSMASIHADAEGGLNTFINEQKSTEGDANFTLVQFDDKYDIVHDGIKIDDVPHCTLTPRGSTALLDAVGKTINTLGERLAKTPESDRPGLVVVVIVTDGGENASHEFNRAQIQAMIEHQQEKYDWEFVYLGANQDAFAEAHAMGINMANVSNYDTSKTRDAFTMTSTKLAESRMSVAAGSAASMSYSAEDRSNLESEV